YMSRNNYFEDSVRIVGLVSKLPTINDPVEDPTKRTFWPEMQISNLRRIVEEIDNGKLKKLLAQPTAMQTKQSRLLNAYWQWVYVEFCSVSIPAGFHTSFKKMRNKIKKEGFMIFYGLFVELG
ncbi:uncharacterized protein LOC111716574, partial [Eurytemora carolleeae]|uniref:uncharacterized protein LOC111716574 n=1 Tax=Eurytemora carolleeae TaxID=1294199 RepID=UPI000C77FB5F